MTGGKRPPPVTGPAKKKPERLVSRCEKCGEILTGEASATRHAKATKHTRYRTVNL